MQHTPIVHRRMEFKLDEFELNWNGGDAYRSQALNAISMTFPVGERWLIDTVRRAIDTLPEDKQPYWREYARGFIAQESTHSAIHRKYNARLEQLGLDNWWERRISKRAEWGATGTPLNQLASSVAYEHMTAVLSGATLRNQQWLAGADPELARLWNWHSSEEMEHKHFIHELYLAIGGGKTRRVLWYLWALAIFMYESHAQAFYNLYRSGALRRWKTLGEALRFNFGWRGYVWSCTWGLVSFVNPWYKFRRDVTDKLAQQWLQDNPPAARPQA
ncbi:metal-dependent hydrolase [Duganella sp. FT92W]|uniref:Metal-dependent hydrolase n=1 Tax=Pseudoduganella rivuli TaxID=2666085 RepID=A0A7X2IU48_9BURK|nr:metal-dependent hydrolase [Pseudoduganella rivuli]MRV75964.1 metal-dependent hydrolase [Pseudoduganella rivuli]